MLFPESRVQVDVLVYIVCHVGVESCEGHCLMLFLASKTALVAMAQISSVSVVYSLVNYDNLTLSKSAKLSKRF